MNYYISDTHFGLEQVIEKEKRPFASVEEMNAALLENINSRCTSRDTLFFVGDVACREYDPTRILQKIHAKKILIVGNHDGTFRRGLLSKRHFQDCFKAIYHFKLIHDSGYDLFLSHYPMAEWDGFYKGRYLFYGHVHGANQGGAVLMDVLPNAVNVGADVNGFMPKTAEELIEARKKQFSIPRTSAEEMYERTYGTISPDVRKKKHNWSAA